MKSPALRPLLIQRRQAWIPSRRGWLVIALLGVMFVLVVAKCLPAFLSPVRPVESRVMVVEGWITDKALDLALQEFRSGKCDLLLTSGGPIEKGASFAEYGTYAEHTAVIARKLGISADTVVAVPAPPSGKDRTYAAAVAVRDWLNVNRPTVKSVNLVSEGPHARRSWMLFRKAFGTAREVGVISVPDERYVIKQWWQYSDGVTAVLGEAIAYLYAKFLFYP